MQRAPRNRNGSTNEESPDCPADAPDPGGPPGGVVPELPDLSPGITLLETGDPGPLRSLVVDHLLTADGSAGWVDAGGVARTPPLLRLAPGRHFLDRIRVARGFTAYQHRALVDRLRDLVSDRTALVVLPRIDYPYRADDCRDARQLLVDGIAALAAAVREYDLPALVTRHVDDAFAAPVENAADRTIAVEDTPFGPRFVGDGVETLVYPGEGYVQTTLAFWRRVLATRHGIDPGVGVDSEDGVATHREGPAESRSVPAGPVPGGW